MYKKILVPIDGSPTSKRGLAEAIRLAKHHKAKVRLIHATAGSASTICARSAIARACARAAMTPPIGPANR